MVIDTETANTLKQPLTYDIGFLIADRKGHIIEEHSFLIYDIFIREKELMESAYYSDKILIYEDKLKTKQIILKNFKTVNFLVKELIDKYKITEIWAYNMRFDLNALNTTVRYLTKSKYRYFFPYGVELKCIWNIATDTIFKQKTFQSQAIKNGWYSNKKNVSTSAETGYKYITQNFDFVESHTGLEDCKIEYEILLRCLKSHIKKDTSLNGLAWRKPQKQFQERLKEF